LSPFCRLSGCKGRFDELFFVDLPNQNEREAIWKIQIGKYRREPDKFDISALAKATDGFIGPRSYMANAERGVWIACPAGLAGASGRRGEAFRSEEGRIVDCGRRNAEQGKRTCPRNFRMDGPSGINV